MNKRLIEFIETEPTEEDCIKFLEKAYWNGTPISPFSKNSPVYKCKYGYKCLYTGKYFNVKNGTLFTDIKTKLIYWFKAISNPNMSSYKLAARIGITQKSAWFILNRIKEQPEKLQEFLTKINDNDEKS